MDVDAENAKLVALARSALPRSRGAKEGAAVRDDTGRTYAAAAVSLGPLALTALELAAAMAASSGVQRLEAAVLVAQDVNRPSDDEAEMLGALGDPTLTVIASGGPV